MNNEQDFERLFKEEFKDISDKLIWQDENGDYRVFGHYVISKENQGYRVLCGASDVGSFATTRSALSWCIADKHKLFNLAREISEMDTKLSTLKNDIQVRANSAEKSKIPDFRETVGTKLESKIIRKKKLENELNKRINFAKYYEQRGLTNETARTSRNPNIKASRKGV